MNVPTNLVQQRCVIHFQREAAARCPSCSRYFCRECVTEHEDRLICATCLGKQIQQSGAKERSYKAVFRVFHLFLAIFALWLFFYYMGEALLSLPDSFHDGTLFGDTE